MATRFYFASLSAPSKSPGFEAWTRTSEGIRRTMSSVKDGSTLADKSFWAGAAAGANDTCLCAQFVSPPLPAGIAFATTDTIKCVFRCTESAANDNINRQPIALKVYAADGTTLQSTLKALGHYGPGTTEWATTNTNRQALDGDTLIANYTTVAGDLLVLEIGGQVSASAGVSVTGTINIGSSSLTDCAENETATAANTPWFEISRTFTFRFAAAAALSIRGMTASGNAAFTAPVYHGTGAATAAPMTASGTATFTGGAPRTGTGAATIKGMAAVASGTFTVPVYHGTGAAAVAAMTCAGVGAFGYHPVSLITQPQYGTSGRRYGSFASKPFSPPISFGNAAVSMGAMTGTGSAAFGYHPVSTLTQFHYALSGRRYGSFAFKGSVRGTVSVSMAGMTGRGSATNTVPAEFGILAQTVGGVTCSSTASVNVVAKTGTAAVSIKGMTCTGTATRTAPVFHASASVFIRGIVGVGTAAYHETDPNTANASAFITMGAMTCAGEATQPIPEIGPTVHGRLWIPETVRAKLLVFPEVHGRLLVDL